MDGVLVGLDAVSVNGDCLGDRLHLWIKNVGRVATDYILTEKSIGGFDEDNEYNYSSPYRVLMDAKDSFILVMYRNGCDTVTSDWYSDNYTNMEEALKNIEDAPKGEFYDCAFFKVPDTEYGRDLCHDIVRDFSEYGGTDALKPIKSW